MGCFERRNRSIAYHQNGELVTVSALGPDGLRVRSTILPHFPEDAGALLPDMDRDACVWIEENRARIQNGDIICELWVQDYELMNVPDWERTLHLTFRNGKGDILLREIRNGGALRRKAREYLPLPGDAFQMKVRFEAQADEKIFGMGQYQAERLNWKGAVLELAQRNSQASVPFYVSSRGYGFLWHNAALGQVFFGTNETQWEAEETGAMDYWICAAETPDGILHRYAEVTGKPPLMPEYGLGFWQSKLRYVNQQEVLDVAMEYKKRGIPLDVLVIDYYHWTRCGDWRFDPEFFPDPETLSRQLREMGIEPMVSVWPAVDWRSENYEEMRQRGLLVRSRDSVDVQMVFHGNNVFIDATNPEARAYVWEKCKKNYYDLGYHLYWLDVAEPEYTDYHFRNYRYYSGSVSRVGNKYPLDYVKGFCEGLQAAGDASPVLLARCAWAGSQRYGALVWSGDVVSDFPTFRKQICAGLQMAMSGIPWWTCDIGGFHGGDVQSEDFRELLIRWFECAAFFPVMRLHGNRLPGRQVFSSSGEELEGTGAGNEIWSYGLEAERIMTRYIRVREAMRDYTRQCMREAHEEGSPVIRPLLYDFPADAQAWQIQDEFMYGPDLLVAPVCQARALNRSVYLPQGCEWTSAWTGQLFAGGREYRIEAPVDMIPVFLRNGQQEWMISCLNQPI